MNKRNFVATVKEPADMRSPNGVGHAIHIELHEEIQGLKGDEVVFHLKPESSMDDAQTLVRLLNQLGDNVFIQETD
ncbi:hypothetical protein EOS_15455 [Caballeronia mineralivorans PML1(12)]|uniref:Uncharacterized protein n=1 Tax=Caballeronia mineralivorans PML1(12) TaxID=908627 RepID=A0A0J1CXV7_9BURK|nr:hypothetical protein [Caballeronia mineralivorans]KLU25387.1 hypothetical protein EOS_15455 [Caballeronia mineralivorans PML1(12)]